MNFRKDRYRSLPGDWIAMITGKPFIRSFSWLLALLLLQNCTKTGYEPTGADRSFAVIGDVRQGFGTYSRLVQHIIRQEPLPEAAFCMGDIMLRPGNDVEWVGFNKKSEPLTDLMPLYLVRGNHEGNDPASELIFSEQTGLPVGRFYHCFALGSSACIILDSNVKDEDNMIGPAQFQWLESTLDSLSSESEVRDIFIFLHHPVYSQGKYKGNKLKNADEVHNLFSSHPKIRVIFSGHDHIYNHHIREGVNYITTCGGGEQLNHGYGGDYYHFVLVSFFNSESRINIKTIGLFNETIEDFDL